MALLLPGGTESPGSAVGVLQGFGGAPRYPLMAGYDKLCDTLSIVDDERLLPVVDEDDFDFAPIIGIYGAGTVQYGDPVFPGQAAAWTHLCFEADGEFNEYARGNKGSLSREQGDLLLQMSPQIHSRSSGRLVGRKGMR